MTNEELTKIAWTRELTDERVAVAVAYWLDCSPHERTEADGIILARYARMAMEKIESLKAITELAVKGLEWYANEDNHRNLTSFGHASAVSSDSGSYAKSVLSEIERLSKERTDGG